MTSVYAADLVGLIAQGESARLEFKSTLRYDLRDKKTNKRLEKVVAKTLAGYLNTEGGTLLIGVADDGGIVGLAHDISTLSTKNLDGFERALRTALSKYLGVEITPHITIEFIELEEGTVARVQCAGHHVPVYMSEGDKQEFYVRDGPATKPLGVQAAHAYIRAHWPSDQVVTREDVLELVSDAMRAAQAPAASGGSTTATAPLEPGTPAAEPTARRPVEQPPPWLRVGTRRVLDLFLGPLARSHGWKRLYIVSPWISEIVANTSMTFDQILTRIVADGTTVYVVTRPPEEDWHEDAIRLLGETTRANIALVPNLHAKLYTAHTASGSFAMLGSANFTQQGLINRELGLLVNGFGQGRRVVSDLNYEAAQIYRIPDRRLVYRAAF